MLIGTVSDYLAERKNLGRQRETFFQALRTYLSPLQRPHAERLGEQQCRSTAYETSEVNWVSNATRGYLVLLEDSRCRPFRFSVEPVGTVLRLSVEYRDGELSNGHLADALTVAKDQAPGGRIVLGVDGAPNKMQWEFPAEQLYTDVQHFEHGLNQVQCVFDAAVFAFCN